MCGIFGVILHPESQFQKEKLRGLIDQMFLLSESRGKDSSGIVLVNNTDIKVFKRPQRARDMIKARPYKQLISQFQSGGGQDQHAFVVMGHARMVTNGSKEFHANNQPVIKDGLVCIHNGIIVNDAALWQQHSDLERNYQVDTEVLLSLVGEYHNKQGLPYVDAIIQAFHETKGANSVALLADTQDALVLATTNGSLYLMQSRTGNEFIFGSEEYIVRQIAAHPEISTYFTGKEVQPVQPCEGYVVRFDDLKPQYFSLNGGGAGVTELAGRTPRHVEDIVDAADTVYDVPTVQTDSSTRLAKANAHFMAEVNEAARAMRRCSRCLLPESFPFIHYDADGVCNYCHAYTPVDLKGEDALHALVDPIRRSDSKADILVPFSGGRDSSYGIHYIKNVLGMNPVAYTYDWGLVTDLARRNISRMCGQLGIEHILISADIKTKRANVRRNVLAWLHKPALGTVPLFMAGDKQFFYYSNLLKQQMDIDVVLYSMNPLERTDFKVGFCGINEVDRKQEQHYALAMRDRLHMMGYYGWHFASNPRYLNASLLDSFFAFVSYYMIPKDYQILYEYIQWDESKINDVLLNQYDWETATDTHSTWRIGDGTASFYNYIYYTAAGFSENDTLRSNQIREGMIDRETAMAQIESENQPRYESMQWYADTIGFDLQRAMRVINAMPKRYAR